jgi:hypothetical protein
MTPKPLFPLLLICLATALVAAGCGGGGDAHLTKAEFIKQADRICGRAEGKKTTRLQAYFLKIHPGPGNPFTHAEALVLAKKVTLPPIRAATKQISELATPEGDEEKIDAFVKSLEEASDRSEEQAEGPSKPGQKTVDSFAEAAKLAREYGFKTCFVNY